VQVRNPLPGESRYHSLKRASNLCAAGLFRFIDDTHTWIVAVPEAQAYQRGVLQRCQDHRQAEARADAATFGRLGFEWRARMSGGCSVMQAESGNMVAAEA